MQIDFCSDVHVDSYSMLDVSIQSVQQNRVPAVAYTETRRLIDQIIPNKPGNVLIIAGDIGERNGNNLLFFRELRKTYEYILVAHGNHDLYLHKHEHMNYAGDSFQKLKHMSNAAAKIGVEYMDCWTRNIGGKIFGGFPMFYDNHYAISNFGWDDDRCKARWPVYMNDGFYIRDGKSEIFDYQAYSHTQAEKMKLKYQECDVIFTHIPPILKNLPVKFMIPESTFWQFDGSEFLKNCENKVWIYGHTHTPYDYMERGCQMFCNPIGYDGQNDTAQIQSFDI